MRRLVWTNIISVGKGSNFAAAISEISRFRANAAKDCIPSS